MSRFQFKVPTVRFSIPSFNVITFKPKGFPELLAEHYEVDVPIKVAAGLAIVFRELAYALDMASIVDK